VLEPLAEIAADVRHPVNRKTVRELLASAPREVVRRTALRVLIGLLMAITIHAQSPVPFFQKGVNFTAERGSYASPRALELLDKIKDYGVNAIALVPYGFTRLGQPDVRFHSEMPLERDEDIARLAAKAHELSMKVMLKPQIWTGRGFPGDLDFPDPGDRAKWFSRYALFLEHYARLAAKIRADILCVGVEFAKLSRYDQEWRALIRKARTIYKGPLVYAAIQGPEFETLKFWDALDYIGLNNYYPLPDDLSTVEVVKKVETVHKKFRKPVIFPEAGYASLEAPHRQPWDETGRTISLEDQARCYEALLRGFYNKPWFSGVYWWKIGNNGFGGPQDGSHTPWEKPAMDVIAKWYNAIRRPEPAGRP
jgi:hypothetical protein